MAEKKYLDLTGLSYFLGKVKTWVTSQGYLTQHQDISGKQDKSTAVTHTASTAVGSATKGVYVASNGKATAMTYAVNKDVPSDAKFTDTLATAETTGSGNAVTSISASNGKITATKGTTFLTTHQDISGKVDNTANGFYGLVGKLAYYTSVPTDTTRIITQNTAGGDAEDYYVRPISSIWSYIKGKADSEYEPKGTTHSSITNGTWSATIGTNSLYPPLNDTETGDSGKNLGAGDNKWNSGYIRNLYCGEKGGSIGSSDNPYTSLHASNIYAHTLKGAVAVDTDQSYDLGTSSKRFKDFYGRYVFATQCGTGTTPLDYLVSKNLRYTRSSDSTAPTSGTICGITSEGYIRKYSGSSLRFKHDVHELSPETNERIHGLYDIKVKNWTYNSDYLDAGDELYDKETYGLIAEDIESVLPDAVIHGADGKAENYSDRHLINALLVLVQEQNERIKALEER